MRTNQTYVYAVRHPDGFVKVGKGKDPQGRSNSIQTGSPYELELEQMVKYIEPSAISEKEGLEDLVHDHLGEYHVRGEWFDISHIELAHILASISEDEELPGFRYIDCDREKSRKQESEEMIGTSYSGPL